MMDSLLDRSFVGRDYRKMDYDKSTIGYSRIIPDSYLFAGANRTGFFALFGFVLWVIVVSILMYQRTGASAGTGAEAPPVAPQPAL